MTCCSSSSGSAEPTNPGLPSDESVSTDWISTPSSAPSMRSSDSWTRSTLKLPIGRATGTVASSIFGEDTQAYGYAAGFDLSRSCEDQVIQQLLDLQHRAAELSAKDGQIPVDEFFYAEQNARLVRNAEEYYRSMFRGRISSWNLRDQHMAETLEALLGHFDRKLGRSKFVVWEHNSHVGDARATELGESGEWTVGQLSRERFGTEAVLVGFSTYSGTVTAASDWGAPAERKRVRPGLPASWEALFHGSGLASFLLPFRAGPSAGNSLDQLRLERP